LDRNGILTTFGELRADHHTYFSEFIGILVLARVSVKRSDADSG